MFWGGEHVGLGRLRGGVRERVILSKNGSRETDLTSNGAATGSRWLDADVLIAVQTSKPDILRLLSAETKRTLRTKVGGNRALAAIQ